MIKFDNNNTVALIGTIIFHLVTALILSLIVIDAIKPKEEDFVFVVLGDAITAFGDANPGGRTIPSNEDVAIPRETAQAQSGVQEEMITQNTEEAVAIANRQRAEEERRQREEAERIERERREAEQRRLAEERQRAQGIASSLDLAFGAGTDEQGSRGSGTSGTGVEGSPFGNSDTGATQGVGGRGDSFSLAGRTLRGGSLPRPSYTIQEEGSIVVDITVDPKGDVIRAEIGRGTNIDNASLRAGAIEAAKRAQFNNIQGTNNQTGTITYHYFLR